MRGMWHLLLAGCLLTGCDKDDPSTGRLGLEAPLPQALSAVGVLRRDGERLTPLSGFAYDLGQPLFSDHASKYRTVHLPPGSAARPSPAGRDADVLAFPLGTLITKTFYYPVRADGRVRLEEAPRLAALDDALNTRGMRLLETRVLRHGLEGWEAVSYLWNETGTAAERSVVGALLPITTVAGDRFDYLVPDRNQCAACHAGNRDSRALAPIGPKPANLAAWRLATGGQYEMLLAAGYVIDPELPVPWPLDARTYLDVNCAHCHNGSGAASSSGLDLGVDAGPAQLGVCRPPVAAGRGSGNLAVDIWPGRPDASILLYRMAHTDPAVMMPELGRSLVHREGVALIRAWIEAMENDCVVAGMG